MRTIHGFYDSRPVIPHGLTSAQYSGHRAAWKNESHSWQLNIQLSVDRQPDLLGPSNVASSPFYQQESISSKTKKPSLATVVVFDRRPKVLQKRPTDIQRLVHGYLANLFPSSCLISSIFITHHTHIGSRHPYLSVGRQRCSKQAIGLSTHQISSLGL